jgi:hypothetical protein
MLPPAENAADLVSVFRAELDLIARWADVQPEALYAYVAELATSDRQVAGGSGPLDDEPRLREEMRRLGLEVTYRRPRPRRVERAMGEAIATLLDHGRLDPRYIPALDRLFGSADPFFVVARPRRRPAVVPPIPERAVSSHLEGRWTSEVTTDDAATGRTMPAELPDSRAQLGGADLESQGATSSTRSDDAGWVVLAEETWLRWLDWAYATETRVGSRLEPAMWALAEEDAQYIDPDDMDGIIPAAAALDDHVATFSHLRAQEYLTRARAPHSIVVRNEGLRFDTPGGGWLAMNPALAVHLGWRPAPTGLFRWLDSEGDVAAESVWWQDGFGQQRPPLFDDEVGRGWLVRASVSGWRQIAAVVGDTVDWRLVTRLARERPPASAVSAEPAPPMP